MRTCSVRSGRYGIRQRNQASLLVAALSTRSSQQPTRPQTPEESTAESVRGIEACSAGLRFVHCVHVALDSTVDVRR